MVPAGPQNTFTALRWLGALMVLVGHSYVFLGLPEPLLLGWAPPGPVGVYIFFSISGYLVAKSWERDPNIGRFLQRRALRILPGLWVCILLTALVLGPLLSPLAWREYFTHPQFFQYFKNLVLLIQYNLPAVFASNTYPHAVNGSLWSLPVEAMLYLLVVVFGLSARVLRLDRRHVPIVVALMVGGSLQWALSRPDMLVFYATDLRQLLICGGYFWVGYLLASSRFDERLDAPFLVLVFTVWMLLLPVRPWFMAFSYLALPCLVIGIGLRQSRLGSWLHDKDWSYGIYIYAFPLQQTVASLLGPETGLASYLALVLPLVLVLAAASWTWVEQPALRAKPPSP